MRGEPAAGVQLPHLHVVVLDAAGYEVGGELCWAGLGHLETREVGGVLERGVKRFERHLRRSGLLRMDEDDGDPDVPGDPESNLAASAVWGQTPPAGPQWVRGLRPSSHSHSPTTSRCAPRSTGSRCTPATRAGGLDPAGREALLCYVLRPPIAQERLEHRPDGLVRIILKKAYSDGTVAVDMDPLSLLCRLATSVPPPRLHTVRYAGVLAAGSEWRARITPRVPPAAADEPDQTWPARGYRRWAELLARTFAVDVLCCPGAHEAADGSHSSGPRPPGLEDHDLWWRIDRTSLGSSTVRLAHAGIRGTRPALAREMPRVTCAASKSLRRPKALGHEALMRLSREALVGRLVAGQRSN